MQSLAGDPHYEEWIGDYSNSERPGVESFSDFSKRIEDGWKKVSEIVSSKEVDQNGDCHSWGRDSLFIINIWSIEKEFWEWKVSHGNGFEFVWSSKEAFRRGDRCNLLREVLLTENQDG